jgi:hypothetical protein
MMGFRNTRLDVIAAPGQLKRSTSYSLKWRKDMRRYFNCLLVALCMAPSTGSLAGQQKLSTPEQEVVNVREARIQAIQRRDVAAWSRYVADDCILSDDDGNLISKAQLREHLKLPP